MRGVRHGAAGIAVLMLLACSADATRPRLRERDGPRPPATPAPAAVAPTATDFGPWQTAELSPDTTPNDSPSLTVAGGTPVAIVSPMMGGGSRIGRRTAGGWAFESLGSSGHGPVRLAGHEVHVLAGVPGIGPPSYRIEYGHGRWGELRFEPIASCSIGPKIGTSLMMAGDAPVIALSCNGRTHVKRRGPSGWSTLAELDDVGLEDAALGPDGAVHAVVRRERSVVESMVVVRGSETSHRALPDGASGGQIAVARDGTVYVLFDALDPDRQARAVHLATIRGEPTVERLGPGRAAELLLDTRDRPVALTGNVVDEEPPRILVPRGGTWRSRELEGALPDFSLGGAEVDDGDRLHLVYAWTDPRRGRVCMYGTVKLPD